jgi:DICT domain-containing protein
VDVEIAETERGSGCGEPVDLRSGSADRAAGLAAAAWVARHGFPRARRLENGLRQYAPADVDTVARVLGYRGPGLSLAAAIERATGVRDRPADSAFAELREARPDLSVNRVSRQTMLAVSRAIEEECAAAGDRPIVVGAFQRERTYRREGTRWRELARTAAAAVVFADFPAVAPGPPVEVPQPASAVLRREWVVACESARFCGVLAGWELPSGSSGAERWFEATWTGERTVAARAVEIGLDLARRLAPEVTWPAGRREVEPEQPAAVVRRATDVTNRIVAHLDSHR